MRTYVNTKILLEGLSFSFQQITEQAELQLVDETLLPIEYWLSFNPSYIIRVSERLYRHTLAFPDIRVPDSFHILRRKILLSMKDSVFMRHYDSTIKMTNALRRGMKDSNFASDLFSLADTIYANQSLDNVSQSGLSSLYIVIRSIKQKMDDHLVSKYVLDNPLLAKH